MAYEKNLGIFQKQKTEWPENYSINNPMTFSYNRNIGRRLILI